MARFPRDQDSFVLGLVGAGINASLTPAMQEREGQAVRPLVDLPADRHGASGAGYVGPARRPAWAERLGFDGLNITHPFKQAIVPLLDELSEDAADLGAVNTVLFRDGRMLGRNTDWSGYSRAFRSVLPDAVHDRAVLVGAGGAGVAVGYGLLRQGAAHVAVLDTQVERALACTERLARRFGDERVSVADRPRRGARRRAGGGERDPHRDDGSPGSALPAELLRDDLWVSDVVYFPLETQLVATARSRGCRVLPGGGMAVHQAVGAFEYFTGRTPDADRMARHFEELTA